MRFLKMKFHFLLSVSRARVTMADKQTYPCTLCWQEPNCRFNPDGPAGDAVDKDEREVGCPEAAVSFTFPGPFSRHSCW